MLIALVILGLSIVVAGGVFAYEFFLKGSREAKTAQLEAAQKAVNIDTVEEYIRLKNRLGSIETLLNGHVELSEFFTMLETRTLANVRFNSLSVSVAEDRTAEIEMSGVARSFNALAAQSTQLASERRLKRAIFSDIVVNTNCTVGFSLTAVVDPRLITSADVLPGISEPDPVVSEAPEATGANIAEPAQVPSAPLATSTSDL